MEQILKMITKLEWYQDIKPDGEVVKIIDLPRRCIDFDEKERRVVFYKEFKSANEYEAGMEALEKNKNIFFLPESTVTMGGPQGFSANVSWTDWRVCQRESIMTPEGAENERRLKELAQKGYPVVHNEIYKKRLLVVKECHNFGKHWFDGYIQLLPNKDPDDWLRHAGIGDEDYFYGVSCFAELPGSPTFAGTLNDYPDKFFVGFDTMHPFTSQMMKADVIKALKECCNQLSERG